MGIRATAVAGERAVRIALLALHFAEYASRLALALSATHEVLLVLRSSNSRDELPDDLRAPLEQEVSVRSFDIPRFRDPRLVGRILAMSRILRDFSPDILHVQEAHVALNGWPILTLRRRVPVVLTVHDHVPHSGVFTTGSWRWPIVQWLRWKADRVIVHGPRMRSELAELSGRRAAERIDVIPHGILGRSGIDDDGSRCEPGTFLFFGRIEAYKGLRYLLDACDALRSRGHVFRLVVAGTGEDLERHRDRIAAAAGIELIDRYISATEVPELFRRATAVVLPYTDATQSGVAAMAFAFARPVIATGVGDVPDVVIDGRTGLLVPPRDARSLADAMERLLVDRALRDALATGAARFARENLSWPRIAEWTCDTYRRALTSGRIRESATQSDGFRSLSRD
jgi:glycosyltransferase involved in cell wall biosynthesis